MNELGAAFHQAIELVITFDAELAEIVGLSLQVSLFAVAVAAAIAYPLGAMLAVGRYRGRRLAIAILNSLMGLPPVVVGLLVYLMLSRSGPLGVLGLLYSPTAMVIAQVILVVPIIAAITRQTIEDLHREYDEQLRAFGLNAWAAIPTLLWDARSSLVTALLAGFGRAIAEVGAVLIVGGNIDHVTRVMTTAIALETSKGNLALALGLGLVLMFIAVTINGAAGFLSQPKHPAHET
ncbi:MAG: ABC transporter permease [Chromatiales bacterium]|jgi:tungstate transport system permease protein|nr:ABC transporter permease [Chromatiales bacterium]